MEIRAEIRAVAESEALLEKLFRQIANDIRPGKVFYGPVPSYKKNPLEKAWHGLHFELDMVNGPQGIPYHYDEDSMRVNWEKCMPACAKILGANGCMQVTFLSIDAPDSFGVILCTAPDGEVLVNDMVYGDDQKTFRKKQLAAFSNNPEAVKALDSCYNLYGRAWDSKDFISAEEKPVEKAAEKPKPSRKAKQENPLIALMRSTAESQGVRLEDLFDDTEDAGKPDPDFIIKEDKETSRLVRSFIRDVEKAVEQLKKKYDGKPRFTAYTALKKENPDVYWDLLEDTIKKNMNSTPAAYFKQTGLIRSGQGKEQLIVWEGKKTAPAKKAPAKKSVAEKPPEEKVPEKKEPEEKTQEEKAEKSAPATKKKPVKKEPVKRESVKKEPAKKKPTKKTPAPKQPKPEPEPVVTPDGVLILRDPERVSSHEFSDNKTLKHVIIPNGVREIASSAFFNSSIESVVFPKSLKIISSHAFFCCKNLKTVTLNEGLEEIQDFAFAKSPALTDAYLPDSLKTMDLNAFAVSFVDYTQSPTTLHLSETVAQRLLNATKGAEMKFIAAAGYVINGERSRSIDWYFQQKEIRESAERDAAIYARKIREREEAEEKARQAAAAAKARVEHQKEAARRELSTRIHSLEQERDSIKGLFAGMKKKKIQAQIDELKEQLRKI